MIYSGLSLLVLTAIAILLLVDNDGSESKVAKDTPSIAANQPPDNKQTTQVTQAIEAAEVEGAEQFKGNNFDPFPTPSEQKIIAEALGINVLKMMEPDGTSDWDDSFDDINHIFLEDLMVEMDDSMRSRDIDAFAQVGPDHPYRQIDSNALKALVTQGDKEAIKEQYERLKFGLKEDDYLAFTKKVAEIYAVSASLSEQEKEQAQAELEAFVQAKRAAITHYDMLKVDQSIKELRWQAAVHGVTGMIGYGDPSWQYAAVLDGDKGIAFTFAVREHIMRQGGLTGEIEAIKKAGEAVYQRLIKERQQLGL